MTPRMTLDRLWAGWRATYIDEVATQRTPDDDACLFERLAAADPAEALVLARNDRAFAVMNAYPYTSGHLMVAPLRHEGTLAALTRDDAAALMALTQDATAAVQAAYAPDGINVGVNIGRAAGAGVPGTCTCTCCRAGRRHQLHDHRGRGAGAPGAPHHQLREAAAAWPGARAG